MPLDPIQHILQPLASECRDPKSVAEAIAQRRGNNGIAGALERLVTSRETHVQRLTIGGGDVDFKGIKIHTAWDLRDRFAAMFPNGFRYDEGRCDDFEIPPVSLFNAGTRLRFDRHQVFVVVDYVELAPAAERRVSHGLGGVPRGRDQHISGGQ